MNEALFNLVNVWSLMLWPLMLADPKGTKVKNKFGIYLGTQVMHPLQACCLDTTVQAWTSQVICVPLAHTT